MCTQGHELSVLRGLGRLLGTPPYPPLLMEYEEPLQVGAGFHPMEVLRYLKGRGYRAFCPLDADGHIPRAATTGGLTGRRRPEGRFKGQNATNGGEGEGEGAVLWADLVAVRALVLPGTSHRLTSRKDVDQHVKDATAQGTWRLGSVLEPQAGMPECIDAVFLHERRLGMR